MVGGALSPEGKGFAPSGSLLDQAHLLPSLGRGLCPEGGPRNNGEGYVDKPVPKQLPTSPSSDQRGKAGGQRGKGMLGPELQLPLRRESGPRPSSLHLQPTPKTSFGSGWRPAEILLTLWLPLRGKRLWRAKTRGAQAPGFILTPAKIGLAF